MIVILVTGPNSNTGSILLEMLREKRVAFRCMSRQEEALVALQERGLETVYGDYDKPPSLLSALEGIDQAFLVCTPDERLEAREINFVDACRSAGVHHIVCLGGLPVPGADSPILAAHRSVEQSIENSGLTFTLVRPLGFMQTVYWMSLPTIREQGTIVGAVGCGKNAHVDLRDVASVICKALTEPGHENARYDITGPAAVTMGEVASILSEELKRRVQYQDLPLPLLEEGMRNMGVPEFSLQHASSIFREIREGRLERVTDTLSRLGIQPRSWQDFARDLAEGKAGAATSFQPGR